MKPRVRLGTRRIAAWTASPSVGLRMIETVKKVDNDGARLRTARAAAGEHAVVVRRDGTAMTVTVCMQGCKETK